MSRWKAFSVHLLISLIVIGGVAAGLFYLWYPPHLLGFAKADRLLGLIAGIDILAGPLLTLVVYKAGKKSLKFDLAVIALAQVAFLAGGLWTVWHSRPVFLVAAFDRYEVVFANEITEWDLIVSPKRYRELPMFGAEPVSLRRPQSEEELFEAMEAAQQGRDLARRPEFYQPIERGSKELISKSRTADDLGAFVPLVGVVLVERVERSAEEFAGSPIVPITSSRGSALVVLDRDSGLPLRALHD